MLKAIEKGDSVVTAGGLHGQVTGVTDEVLTLDVGSVKGDRVRVKIARARIDSVQRAKSGDTTCICASGSDSCWARSSC